ncbi:MAG: DUF2271 domain-containing protein [Clostridiales bacterium]|nr:DUF2271 domain-containing protein [Clostridiales bacterium]
MNIKNKLAPVICAALFIAVPACAAEGGNRDDESSALPSVPAGSVNPQTETALPDAGQTANGEVLITLDYEKQSGSASNQFAVWIEDMDGRIVRTLCATRFTANGGYKNRPDSIPLWVEKSGLASMRKDSVDAVTQATPNAGALSYAWDLKDADGETVPEGEYKYFAEGSLRWKNRVLYSGVITVGGGVSSSEADVEYLFEASGNQPALTEAAPETKMLSGVRAAFSPAE